MVLVMLMVELQNICKKNVEQKNAVFFKSWGFKDVKYDLPMCKSHSTQPQPIQCVIISGEIPEN